MAVETPFPTISKTAALTAIATLAQRWNIPKTERYRLLAVPPSTANHWFADVANNEVRKGETLPKSVIERISHVLSIYDLLHRIVRGEHVDGWIDEQNPAFGFQSPRTLILSERFDDLLRVRWHLEQIAAQ